MEEKKMIKFNEQEKIDSVNGALALRPQINEIVDETPASTTDLVSVQTSAC